MTWKCLRFVHVEPEKSVFRFNKLTILPTGGTTFHSILMPWSYSRGSRDGTVGLLINDEKRKAAAARHLCSKLRRGSMSYSTNNGLSSIANNLILEEGGNEFY